MARMSRREVHEFRESWPNDRPDCLLLDLQMPGLSGTDVQRALIRAGANIPVIIITALDSPDVREECMRDGAVAYPCKPMDNRALLNAVGLAAKHGLSRHADEKTCASLPDSGHRRPTG